MEVPRAASGRRARSRVGSSIVGRPTIDEPLRRLAEDPAAFLPTEPGEERIEDGRFVISLQPESHPWSVGVQRLRLDPSEVGPTVAEIRDLLTARGRSASMW